MWHNAQQCSSSEVINEANKKLDTVTFITMDGI